MLTFLSIEKAEKRKILPLFSTLHSEIKSAEGVEVMHITYKCKGKKIPWKKISRLCGDERERLLVAEDVDLPQNEGLHRFECDELSVRLCLNMAIAMLRTAKSVPKELKVGVYDPDGRIADGVGVLLKYVSDVIVTTRMVGMYTAEAQRIAEETGAVLTVSRRLKSLSSCQLLIAPLRLNTQLPVDKSSIILTSQPPSTPQRCGVYYKYYFALSKELLKLLPHGFDAEYFASALYTLCSRFDMGSTVPQAAKGTGEANTLVSMSRYLINVAENGRNNT